MRHARTCARTHREMREQRSSELHTHKHTQCDTPPTHPHTNPPTQVRAELERANVAADKVAMLLPHKVFAGNRPTNSIVMPRISPKALGSLVALYEHKIFVQGGMDLVSSLSSLSCLLSAPSCRLRLSAHKRYTRGSEVTRRTTPTVDAGPREHGALEFKV